MRSSSSVSPRLGERAADEIPPRRPIRCGPGRVTDICKSLSVICACRGRVDAGDGRGSWPGDLEPRGSM